MKLHSPKDSGDELFTSCSHPVTHQDVEKLIKAIMIAQATLDASLAALTTAVNNAAAAIAAGSPVTSTPDSVVAAYQAGVDAQTVALAAATPPAATPKTP